MSDWRDWVVSFHFRDNYHRMFFIINNTGKLLANDFLVTI